MTRLVFGDAVFSSKAQMCVGIVRWTLFGDERVSERLPYVLDELSKNTDDELAAEIIDVAALTYFDDSAEDPRSFMEQQDLSAHDIAQAVAYVRDHLDEFID